MRKLVNSYHNIAKNQTNIKAVLYDFIIIGEATRNVPKEIQSLYPLIPLQEVLESETEARIIV